MLKPKPKPPPPSVHATMKKELDGLLKFLHKKYNVKNSDENLGLGAWFDEKDTEQAKEGRSIIILGKTHEGSFICQSI